MSTAQRAEAQLPTPPRRRRWALAVVGLLAVALALRLWGIKQGLPYAYNVDEDAHYVPRAIGMFGHSLNAHYFVNPPAYTYLLHAVFAVAYGGRAAVDRAFATDPQGVFVLARAVAAVLGTLAVWLLYLAGSRLLDRRAGFIAATLLTVAYLPVFYAHQALNDTPTLAPVCLALWGAALVARRGRLRDCAIAGLGLGLASATKYTGGIVALCLLGAIAARGVAPGRRLWALRGLAVAGLLGLAGFLAADPYSVLSWHTFTGALSAQSLAADDALGKLGLTQHDGYTYSLWTLSWGLGWVPLVASFAGAGVLLVRDRVAAVVLVPAPIAFVIFMGAQGRHFGRWLLPVFPMACLLAAAGAVALLDRLGAAQRLRERRRWLAPASALAVMVALGAQGLVHSLHSDVLLSRQDTRGQARTWLAGHVAPGTKIVVEPIVPGQWLDDVGRASTLTAFGDHWQPFTPSALLAPGSPRSNVATENYERSLTPALISGYERTGYCWVITGSTQSGRAFVAPRAVPGAIRYYRTLARRGVVAARFSPYRPGSAPVRFNFDWSFDSYPLAYDRPGPVVTIWRLRDGGCSSVD
jgi:hypothetical protein